MIRTTSTIAMAMCLSAGLILADAASSTSYAQDTQSPWMVRFRGIGVVPNAHATVSPIGGTVDIDDSFMPELDITYFFTDNIAVELILATTKHDVTATPSDTGLGDVWLLPPTLTAQYHFMPDSKISPYAGVGVNYTIFYNDSAAPGLAPITYDDSFGLALQVGVDLKIDDHWLFNIDTKKIFLDTDVSIAGGAITADVDIDPWVFGFGVGYRF